MSPRTFTALLFTALLFMTFETALARGAGGGGGGGRGGGRGEANRLQPGMDQNLQWVEWREVAELAAQSKKPILVYFYEGEKTDDNVRSMIDVQFRLFPDEEVRSAAASFICTKLDLQQPEPTGRPQRFGGGGGGVFDRDDAEEDGDSEKDGDAEDEGGDADGQEDGEEDGAGEGGLSADDLDAMTPKLALEKKEWPKSVAIYLLDYRGRPIHKITRISSNSRNFISTLKKATPLNDKRIKSDEKDAEKARRKAEREAEKAKRAAERAAEEEAEKGEEQ